MGVLHEAQERGALKHIRAYVASMNALISKGSNLPRYAVGTLHTDNAGEFLSREFEDFLDASLIEHSTCPPTYLQSSRTIQIRSTLRVRLSVWAKTRVPASSLGDAEPHVRRRVHTVGNGRGRTSAL